ncbi:MAG TPA: hypothetical protein DHW63_01960 [Hyphomonadaceae bacterium]|nr:hypothetical protein [Hyphomonadaceae bacterium]
MWRAVIATLVMSFAAAPVMAQPNNQIPASCTQQGAAAPQIFGSRAEYRGCTTLPANLAQYGEVFVRFRAPDDIAVRGSRAQRRDFWTSLRRYFSDRQQSGEVLLKLTLNQNGATTDLRTISLASFTITEQGGVNVEATQQVVQNNLTPIFQVTDGTRVEAQLIIRATSETTGQITARTQELANIAGGFGGHGFLLAAMNNDPLVGRLRNVEQRLWAINNNQRTVETVNVMIGFQENEISGVRYQFGIDPRPRGDRSGLLEVHLDRRASLFTPHSTPTSGQTQRLRFDFDDPEANATEIMRRSLAPSITVKDYLNRQSGVSAALTNLARRDVTPNDFGVACDTLYRTLSDNTIGLSVSDQRAVLWAAIMGGDGQVIRRPEILTTPCVASRREPFSNIGLGFPPERRVGLRPQDLTLRLVRNRYFQEIAAPGVTPGEPQILARILTRDDAFSMDNSMLVVGQNSAVVRLVRGGGGIMLVAFLDRNADEAVDAFSRTLWLPNDGAVDVRLELTESGCDNYFVVFGAQRDRQVRFRACPSEVTWTRDWRQGQPEPVRVPIGNSAGAMTDMRNYAGTTVEF